MLLEVSWEGQSLKYTLNGQVMNQNKPKQNNKAVIGGEPLNWLLREVYNTHPKVIFYFLSKRKKDNKSFWPRISP